MRKLILVLLCAILTISTAAASSMLPSMWSYEEEVAWQEQQRRQQPPPQNLRISPSAISIRLPKVVRAEAFEVPSAELFDGQSGTTPEEVEVEATARAEPVQRSTMTYADPIVADDPSRPPTEPPPSRSLQQNRLRTREKKNYLAVKIFIHAVGFALTGALTGGIVIGANTLHRHIQGWRLSRKNSEDRKKRRVGNKTAP